MDRTDKRTEMIKNLAERTIDLKYQYVQELNYSDMTQQEAAEYKEADKKYAELQDKLSEELTLELRTLFMKYTEAETNVLSLEESYMYKKGVLDGLTDLYFIREIMGNSVVLLE